ncbi:MAG: response regulator, partial [Blautia sp.]|nr:response regulator [Blautia sp.]
MNLLIVDDEMIAIKGMMNGIDWKKCGIDGNVWTAYSLRSALQILKAQPVDIMLCDIEMPGGTGIDLLREVRDFNENISCIFLTCHADFQYAQEAITLG